MTGKESLNRNSEGRLFSKRQLRARRENETDVRRFTSPLSPHSWGFGPRHWWTPAAPVRSPSAPRLVLVPQLLPGTPLPAFPTKSRDLFPRQAQYLPEDGAGSLLPSPWKQMTNARWQVHKAKCSQITGALAAGTCLQSHCWAYRCELISTVMVLEVSWWPLWGKSFAGTAAMFLATWGEAYLPANSSVNPPEQTPHRTNAQCGVL